MEHGWCWATESEGLAQGPCTEINLSTVTKWPLCPNLCDIDTYNTTDLSYRPSSFSMQSSEVVHLHALVAQTQCYCRLQSIVCEELAQGPYTVTVSDKARTRTLRITG